MKTVGGRWSNWSGGVTCKPRKVVSPKDEVELAAAIRQADGPVRTPGTGHSFTPLNASDGTLIDLGAFTGLKSVDAERQTATLSAATPLWQVGPLLHEQGFGLKNMGDIDRQTLGGVVGTGTHGTGRTLRSFFRRGCGLPPGARERRSGRVLGLRQSGHLRGRPHLARRIGRDDGDRDQRASCLQAARAQLPAADRRAVPTPRRTRRR